LFGVGCWLGWLVGFSVGFLLPFGRSCGGGIRLPLRLLLGRFCCLGSLGGWCFFSLGCRCILGFRLGGGWCLLGCCLRGGPFSGGLSPGVSSLLLIFGCLGGGLLLCVVCPFFRRWLTILSLGA